MKLLVTGADGFIGSALVNKLKAFGDVIEGTRKSSRLSSSSQLIDLDKVAQGDFRDINLDGVDVLIHAAAKVHEMDLSSDNALADYENINVMATRNLARLAAESGVKRFIFLSTIKVNGESTDDRKPFTADEVVETPQEVYARSKYVAEQALFDIAQETDLEIVIIRPPLVYGPGVKANFKVMLDWVGKGIPLPLGAIHNKRSLVFIDNLCDLIITCVDHPAAKNQIFLVSDGEDVSTSELLRKIAKAQGRVSRIVAIPEVLLSWSAKLFGKKDQAQKLLGSLQVDNSKTMKLLNWKPVVSVDDGLKITVEEGR